MYEHGFLPTISKPTRITHVSATLIDNIYVKPKQFSPHSSFIVTDPMSDHFPCLLSYQLFRCYKDKSEQIIVKRKFKDDALMKIRQDLLMYDWSELYHKSVNGCYETLAKVIAESFDRHAPSKVIKIRACDKFCEAWMTVSIKKYNAKCCRLCNKAHLTGSLNDITKYKQYRNTLNKIKQHGKKMHYDDLFNKIGKNTKLVWNVVNNILRKTSNKSDITEISMCGARLTEQSDIRNAFNEHFSTAGMRVKGTINRKCDDELNPLLYVRCCTNNLLMLPVTEQHICKIVGDLKSKRSCGIDNMSNTLLKQLVNVLKVPLCVIFNKSLSAGEFPDLMKIAKVIPLHKGGPRDNVDNYRPISLLPVISKVLERITYKYLVSHLDKEDLLYARQFGFRKKHSTIDAITNLTGEILGAFGKKMMLLSVFIDLRKAFDSIPHSLVLAKLEKLGVRDTELEWYRSYLTRRCQYTVIGTTCSETKLISAGVPQGSLLDVLLFQIMINDLPASLRFVSSILYADDTTLYVIGSSLKFMRAKMQSDLNSLCDWLCVNGMKLNASKTKSLIFNQDR